MRIKKWLTINKNGVARITTGKPDLKWDEVTMLLSVNVPDLLFQRPSLKAEITIPEEAAGPEEIKSTVVEDVREAIKTATGLEMHVGIIKHEVKDEHTDS
jgi:hypothetical protein